MDMESLCVVAGKHVWSVRVDLHILDNGGYVLLGYALSDDIINLRTNTSKLWFYAFHCHAFPSGISLMQLTLLHWPLCLLSGGRNAQLVGTMVNKL